MVRFDCNSLRDCLIRFPKARSYWWHPTQVRTTSLLPKIFQRCSSLSQEPSQVLHGPLCQSSTLTPQKLTLRCKFFARDSLRKCPWGRPLRECGQQDRTGGKHSQAALSGAVLASAWSHRGAPGCKLCFSCLLQKPVSWPVTLSHPFAVGQGK